MPDILRRTLLLVMLASLGCGEKVDSRFEETVPTLRRDLVIQVTTSDDSSFVTFAREAGNRVLRDAFDEMYLALGEDSGRVFDKRSEFLQAPMHRIARVLESEYDLPGTMMAYESLFARPRAAALARLRLGRELMAIAPDRDMPAGRKLERLHEMLDESIELKLPDTALVIKSAISERYREAGRVSLAREYLEDAIEDSYRIKIPQMTCQLLGQLASYYREGVDVDSATVCYDEALRVAVRYRLPVQAARITTFYAIYHLRQGRLAVATSLYHDVMRYCRDFKAGKHEVRFVLWAMEMQANFECWEAVERLILRARVLEREFDVPEQKALESANGIRNYYEVSVDAIEMRMLLARGDVRGAWSIFEDVHDYIRRYGNRGTYASFLYLWVKGLVDNNQHEEALPFLAEGEAFCRQAHVDDWTPKFIHLSARVSLEKGLALAALSEVRRFEQANEQFGESIQQEFTLEPVQVEVVRARAYILLGDTASAQRALDAGFQKLDAAISGMQGGVLGYLWLGRGAELRELLLEFAAQDPRLGYGAVLYWESLGRRLGSELRASPGSRGGLSVLPTRLEAVRHIAEKSVEAVTSRGTVHLVYAVRGDEVWRWTVARGAVEVKVLAPSRTDLERLVQQTLVVMSRDPGHPDSPMPRGLADDLRSLARSLLPASVVAGERNRLSGPVAVTTGGFLARLPFGALNVGSGERFVPLLDLADVVYLRYTGNGVPERQKTDDHGVVFVCSKPSQYAVSRFPLSGDLPGARSEGSEVAAAFPGSRHYHGKTATKDNLLDSWENASFLYIASHIYRDPEIPYVSLIPMWSATDDTDPEAAFLDISDVRAADLSGCSVAVLSGCSSGTPFPMAWNTVPSLGDVFLDSGIGATVQTFWDLRDLGGDGLMSGVVKQWQKTGLGDFRALNERQRGLVRGPSGVRHPYNWATYFIKIGHF